MTEPVASGYSLAEFPRELPGRPDLIHQRNDAIGLRMAQVAVDLRGDTRVAPSQALEIDLCEAKQPGIEKEVGHVVELARKSDDPYLVALAAGASLSAGQERAGKELLDKLAGLQQEDGHLEGKQGSITRSGGLSQPCDILQGRVRAGVPWPDVNGRLCVS